MRSRTLTERGLGAILLWARRRPHDLAYAAKAAGYFPADVLGWYAAGQHPDCPDRLMVELAWEVDQFRAEAAAKNYERLVKAADGGRKEKTVVESDGSVQTTTEDVLPNLRAIEKLEEMQAASAWQASLNDRVAKELLAAMIEEFELELCGEIVPAPKQLPDSAPGPDEAAERDPT
jgi:hypothetical protein